MGYLQNIIRFSGGDNLGGILTLRVIRKDDLAGIPEPVDGVVYGDVVPKEGKAFVTWNVVLESANTRSNNASSREGPSKQNSLPFLIPKDRPSIKAQLDQAEEDEFIVIFTDANGIQKLFGTIDTPVKFSYDHTSGKAFDNINAYDCNFYYSGPDNFLHYNGSLPSPPVGSSPAVVMYNGSPIASLQPGEVLNIISDFGFTDFYITA